jgi:hypothetical protein
MKPYRSLSLDESQIVTDIFSVSVDYQLAALQSLLCADHRRRRILYIAGVSKGKEKSEDLSTISEYPNYLYPT